MPELPEVETICIALRAAVEGATVKSVTVRTPQLRSPLERDRLTDCVAGQQILGVRRRGKYLIVELPECHAMLLHLGMTGSFRIEPPGSLNLRHDHVIWHLADGRDWVFNDPRRFGQLRLCRLNAPGGDPDALAALGPEPLGPSFTSRYLRGVAHGRAQPIKNLIMDQRVVVGVGNIYANEALFRAGIHPRRPAGRISAARLARLVAAIREVLLEAIACGGTTISDYRDLSGNEGRFRICLSVYDREGHTCPRCERGRIRRTVQAGRSTFYCASCQH